MDPLFPRIDDPGISLNIASDREVMTHLFRQNIPDFPKWEKNLEIASVRVVKYRPGRRCTVLYEVGRARQQVYVKMYCNKRGESVLNKMRELKGACLQTPVIPEAFAYLPEHRMLLIEGLKGTPLSQLHGTQLETWVRRAAEVLAHFHDCGAEIKKVWTLKDEIAVLSRRVQMLAQNEPKSVPTVLELVTTLWAREPNPDSPVRPIHRDLYPAQVIALGDEVGFVDLDDSALGDPAIDVGNFLAHLTLLSFQRHPGQRALDGVRETFLDRYVESSTKVSAERIAFFEASTLLRLASLASDRPGSTQETQAMLSRARQLFSSPSLL